MELQEGASEMLSLNNLVGEDRVSTGFLLEIANVADGGIDFINEVVAETYPDKALDLIIVLSIASMTFKSAAFLNEIAELDETDDNETVISRMSFPKDFEDDLDSIRQIMQAKLDSLFGE